MAVQPRDYKFSFDGDLPRYWFAGQIFETHFFNALSSLLPEGERFLIRTARHFNDRLTDPAQQDDLAGFVAQEGNHSKQHDAHVSLLLEQGFTGLVSMNRFFRRVMATFFKYTPRYSLAVAASVEHLTTTLARTMTNDPQRWLEPMSPAMRNFWEWHAIEELEHKAVAYDLAQGANIDFPLRCLAMLQVVAGFSADLFVRHCYLLYKDGVLADADEWRRGTKLLLGKDGLIVAMFSEVRQFLRRDFHPNEDNDQPIIDAYQAAQA